MISRKQLTYIKNRLRRGGKGDGFFMPTLSPFKASVRDIIRGLRLFKQVPIYAMAYEGMLTKRLNNMAFANLIACIKHSDTPEAIEAFIARHKEIEAMAKQFVKEKGL